MVSSKHRRYRLPLFVRNRIHKRQARSTEQIPLPPLANLLGSEPNPIPRPRSRPERQLRPLLCVRADRKVVVLRLWVMTLTKLGRNDPCHCGSGKKYKKCHEAADDAKEAAELAAIKAKGDAEKAAADAAAAEADPEAAKAAKRAAARPQSHATKPKERITTAANPIRRKAV